MLRRGPATSLHRSLSAAGGVGVGALAGYVFSRLHTPIPWMLGPLLTLAVLRVFRAPLTAPRGARQLGQWVVGTALGLYFTPAVVQAVAGLWWMLLAAALFALANGYTTGSVLARLARIDRTSAMFASVPGGAAEMANLGERYGARVDFVAAAQSVRILVVVLLLPTAFTLLGLHGRDPYVSGTTRFDAAGFAFLMLATLAGSLVASKLRLPNAFVLGSLAVAIPLTASAVDLSTVPTLASNAAQCLLGCSLGARFGPEFLHGAHRFLGAVLGSILLGIALSVAFGLVLAWLSSSDPATLVLGTSPGGIAEMCITAKALQLGVPLVTACHVARVVVLLLSTGPVLGRAVGSYSRRAPAR